MTEEKRARPTVAGLDRELEGAYRIRPVNRPAHEPGTDAPELEDLGGGDVDLDGTQEAGEAMAAFGAGRGLVRLARESPVPPSFIVYLNRLSDLLFTLARLANHRNGTGDVTW